MLEETPMLTMNLRQKLLEIARASVEGYLKEAKIPTFQVTEPELLEKGAAFVTLTKGGRLRGCIGYTDPTLPLYQTVASCAVSAAFSDPRFTPLRQEEFPQIRVEISILTPLRKIEDIAEIQVGKDGLLIKKGACRGLLLPQVATEYGWDKETFLKQTCCKARLPADAWKEGAEIYAFSAEIFHE
jgi:AmmeMemoRadiSam system protein A